MKASDDECIYVYITPLPKQTQKGKNIALGKGS